MLEKKLLAGVPPLRYGDPSAVCYIGAAQRLLEALGETVGQDELFALCGARLMFSVGLRHLLRRSWYHPGNSHAHARGFWL